ncbi:MAG: hypothetical protein ACRDBM_12495, partial [Sporomusa sp.]
RELKFASEQYFKKEISADSLQETEKDLRKTHWNTQRDHGTDFITSNEFSFYHTVLDTAILLNAIPARYYNLALLPLDTRGYQGAETKPSLENLVEAARRIRYEAI